jgi:beta-alanine degradation protein BauB
MRVSLSAIAALMFAAATLPAGVLTPRPSAPVAPPLPSAIEAGWKGEKICTLLLDNAQMRVARCVFPPGGGHERHFHPPHWGYIEQGTTMRITSATGTVDRVLKSGSTWWSDGIAWHAAINIGKTTAAYIIVEPKQHSVSRQGIPDLPKG